MCEKYKANVSTEMVWQFLGTWVAQSGWLSDCLRLNSCSQGPGTEPPGWASCSVGSLLVPLLPLPLPLVRAHTLSQVRKTF